MATGRLKIETISGLEWLYYKILPRRWFVGWRIRNAGIVQAALRNGVDLIVELPRDELWLIRNSGEVTEV